MRPCSPRNPRPLWPRSGLPDRATPDPQSTETQVTPTGDGMGRLPDRCPSRVWKQRQGERTRLQPRSGNCKVCTCWPCMGQPRKRPASTVTLKFLHELLQHCTNAHETTKLEYRQATFLGCHECEPPFFAHQQQNSRAVHGAEVPQAEEPIGATAEQLPRGPIYLHAPPASPRLWGTLLNCVRGLKGH